jgi:FAD/FMN-containing dehydrogenase
VGRGEVVSTLESLEAYSVKKTRVADGLRRAGGRIALRKKSISNLFRYSPRHEQVRRLNLSDFDHLIAVDPVGRTLDVEGLATFERIVDATLPHGLIPPVTPELKHITIGGAICGIGIESTCFRHGFVHDGLIDADVLLGDGRVAVSSATNAHADLFEALPNSYGTLGYVLRATIRLVPVKPFVHLTTTVHANVPAYLEAMRAATEEPSIEFIEGLIVSSDRLFLLTARSVDEVPRLDDIFRQHVFYQLAQQPGDVYLTTKDYLFRYDPDWFWNIPDSPPYRLFRRYAPLTLRNSSFYTRHTHRAAAIRSLLHLNAGEDTEPLIQDWEVPWATGRDLIEFAVSHIDLEGRPWAIVPIRTSRSPTLYPIAAHELYLNLGCYCHVKKTPGQEPYYTTRLLDRKCFELGGIKMLYSSSFLSEEAFNRIYNGDAYQKLKATYDRDNVFPGLYEKCVQR